MIHFWFFIGHRSLSHLEWQGQNLRFRELRHTASQPRKVKVEPSPRLYLGQRHKLIKGQGVLGGQSPVTHISSTLTLKGQA